MLHFFPPLFYLLIQNLLFCCFAFFSTSLMLSPPIFKPYPFITMNDFSCSIAMTSQLHPTFSHYFLQFGPMNNRLHLYQAYLIYRRLQRHHLFQKSPLFHKYLLAIDYFLVEVSAFSTFVNINFPSRLLNEAQSIASDYLLW